MCREYTAVKVNARVRHGAGFAGSVQFVYLHVLPFTVGMLFVERSPWPALTLIVSLEAIFLSTFVMIGQNRQSDLSKPTSTMTSTSRSSSSRRTPN